MYFLFFSFFIYFFTFIYALPLRKIQHLRAWSYVFLCVVCEWLFNVKVVCLYLRVPLRQLFESWCSYCYCLRIDWVTVGVKVCVSAVSHWSLCMSMGGQNLSCMLNTLPLPVWSPVTPQIHTHTLALNGHITFRFEWSVQCTDWHGLPHTVHNLW